MLINIDYHIFDQIEVPDDASLDEVTEAIRRNAAFFYNDVDWEPVEENE